MIFTCFQEIFCFSLEVVAAEGGILRQIGGTLSQLSQRGEKSMKKGPSLRADNNIKKDSLWDRYLGMLGYDGCYDSGTCPHG